MQVLAPNSEQARIDIEALAIDPGPPVRRIVFVQDGAGQWFITYTSLNWSYFAHIRQFMIDNTHEVTYVPPVLED